MTVRHLLKKDPDRWYVINVNYGERTGKPAWHERKVELHGPKILASASWSLFGHGFGWGFQFGRNGSESDAGLDLYAGRLGSLWLRLAAPWTRWLQSKPRRDGTYRETGDKDWYKARHYGVRLFPHRGSWVAIEIAALEGEWSSKEPWYRHMTLNHTAIFGRVSSDKEEVASGVTRVPMPEGTYAATYTEDRTVTRHVRWPGTWLDRAKPRPRQQWVHVAVEGGIPCEGKGENSYDCGMDGEFGASGKTVEEAVGNYVKAVLRNRENYGGPHDLDRPMTVSEAEARVR